MALSGSIIERFAEVSGVMPSSIDRMLRPLRDAEMVARGEPGRTPKQGSDRIPRKGHYEPPHLTNVIFGFAGAQPSDAAEAVKVLRPLVFEASAPPTGASHFGTGDLGSLLDKIVDRWGTWHADDEDGLRVAPGLEMVLSLNPPSARLTFEDADGSIHTERFGPASPRSVPGVQRLTLVSNAMFRLAAELWDDALRCRAATPFGTILTQVRSDSRKVVEHQNPSPSDAPASAAPEDENAATLPCQRSPPLVRYRTRLVRSERLC
jgi:hypothetical protein